MTKDFDKWNKEKKRAQARNDIDTLYFKERDVWWARIGVNIGFEQDGMGEFSQRPVLVIRKFNQYVMLVLPLTTKIKSGNKYYFSFESPDNIKRSAILSQVRLIDIKRLTEHMFKVDKKTFETIKKATIDIIADHFFENSSPQKAG